MTAVAPGVIAVDRVSKWYGQVSALNSVTLTVPPGVTGLLGPNGAGKSTLLKLVTGQLRPSQGTVTVFGEPVWGNASVFSRVGVCPEHDAFHDGMSGLEWVTALTRLTGLSEAAAASAAERAVAAVDLSAAAHRKIGAYSRGMRQAIKLAQAIAHDPELLVLDEPLSGMDPRARRRTIGLVREWGRSGRSVLVSSHVLHEIEAMTSRVVLMHQGAVLAEGDVHHLRDLVDGHPHTVHVRSNEPRKLARALLAFDDVLSLRLDEGMLVVQTATPDAFYARLTDYAASEEFGAIEEVSSPDDSLETLFGYLVR